MRGSFATKVLRSGIEIKDISMVLGHSKIETTENYYITSTKDTLKKVCESFEKENNYKILDKFLQVKDMKEFINADKYLI